MKKQYTFFEKQRINYVVAIMKCDYKNADIYMASMRGFKRAVYEFNIYEGFRIHDEIMSAIDFGYRMFKMKHKKEKQN